ncbi:methyltransferase domain-containing protein [Nitrospira sp. Kam-Ns4a]
MPLSCDERELGQFIPLHYHYNMLNDRARMVGFQAALARLVRPGARVLELGGGTGVLSFFEAQRAARVWCVERNPQLVREARRLLGLNAGGGMIEVVEADAFEYLPPEPVDLVICEMLHVGLLREQQIPVLASFKARYLGRFGGPLPTFVPEATLQAVQPVQQCFDFHGYYAPTVLFQDPTVTQPATRELGEPALFQRIIYEEPLPDRCAWDGLLTVRVAGTLNALRFATKNLLAILVNEGRTVDWFNQYLIVPLPEPLAVQPGDRVGVRFAYRPGDPLDALCPDVRFAPPGA